MYRCVAWPSLALAIMCASAAAENRVGVLIKLQAPDSLSVSYRLPPACRSLAFVNDGIQPAAAEDLRKDWQSADGCATVDGQRILLNDLACSEAQFTVRASFKFMDRVYPWAMPLGGGVYAHTQSYAVKPDCGPVDWQFSAPQGSVVINGKVASGEEMRLAETPAIDFSPILLFEHVQTGTPSLTHVDPTLPSALVDAATHGAQAAEQYYKTSFQETRIPEHSLVIIGAPRNAGEWGDAANRTTLRLMVQRDASPKHIEQVNGIVAHELAHFLQPRDLNDAWQTNQTLVIEGGAEFLRVQTQLALGWISPDAAAAELQLAFNACALATENHSWKDTPGHNWNKIPYDCGLAFHVVALADRQTPQLPVALLDHYYHLAQKGARTDFASALECGSMESCSPRWLPRLMNSSELVTTVFDDFGRQTGLIRVTSDSAAEFTESIARTVFATLMKQDCGGQVSTWADPGLIRIGTVSQCKTLREGMLIDQVDGLHLVNNPQAVQRVAIHCSERRKVALGLRDGTSITLACGPDAVPRMHFYTVNRDALLMAALPTGPRR